MNACKRKETAATQEQWGTADSFPFQKRHSPGCQGCGGGEKGDVGLSEAVSKRSGVKLWGRTHPRMSVPDGTLRVPREEERRMWTVDTAPPPRPGFHKEP